MPPTARAILVLLLAGVLLSACRGRVGPPEPLLDRDLPRALRPLRPDSLEHEKSERDADLTAVELDLTFSFEARRVEGRVTNRIRALVEGTRRIRFQAQDLEIESVHDSQARRLAFEIVPPWLEIELAEPLPRGAEEALIIAYHAAPQSGLYFTETIAAGASLAPEIWSQNEPEELRCWVPTWDYPSDRARYEAHLRVGEDMVALSNGVLLDVQDHGAGEHTYHWKLDQEIPTYLIAVAAGRWEHYADRWRELPLDYYVAPGTGEEDARRAFGETPRMLDYFTDLLGQPFPYPKYAQVAVADFVMGGMENASLTLQNDAIVVGADEALDLDGDPRLLVAHELAHQWFGDLVTCLGWSNLWLNEGWASYMELLFQGHVEGRENMRLWLERYRETYLARGALTRLPLSETWRVQASPTRCNHEYDKGPWVLYMIQRQLGDAAFWQGVHAYLERHKNGFVTSADFARAIFDATGRSVDALIEQWVEGSGQPLYRVSFEVEPAPETGRGGVNRLRLRVRQAQELDELVPLFDMPVTIALYGRVEGDAAGAQSSRVTRHTVRVKDLDETFELAFAGELVDVVFDAECGVLCRLEIEKDAAQWAHQSRIPDNSAARWRAIDGLSAIALAKSNEHAPAGSGAARDGIRSTPPEDALLARRALIERLEKDDQPMVRAKAARSAIFPAARAALLHALDADPDAAVRLACARTLRRSEPSAEEAASAGARLARERSPAVRREIARWLGWVDEPKVLPR